MHQMVGLLEYEGGFYYNHDAVVQCESCQWLANVNQIIILVQIYAIQIPFQVEFKPVLHYSNSKVC